MFFRKFAMSCGLTGRQHRQLQYLEHSGISCTPFIPEALEMSRVFSKGTVLWLSAAGRPK